MYLQFIIFSDFLTLLENRFGVLLSRLLPPSDVCLDLIRLFLPTADAHILASHRVFPLLCVVYLSLGLALG